MAQDKTKRERLFDRAYDDEKGISTITDSKTGEVAKEFSLTDIAAPLLAGGALRYFSDKAVALMSNVRNAEGGTMDKAIEAVDAFFDELAKGEYTFRAGAGEGGLTVEQEMAVIVPIVVSLGYAPDEAAALAKVQSFYAETTTRDVTVKGKTRTVVSHPKYNKLKTVPQIREALDKASGNEGKDVLDSMFKEAA